MKKIIYIGCFILLIFVLCVAAILAPAILLDSFQNSRGSLLVVLFGLITGMSLLYVVLRVSRKMMLPKQAAKEIDMFTEDESYFKRKSVRIG